MKRSRLTWLFMSNTSHHHHNHHYHHHHHHYCQHHHHQHHDHHQLQELGWHMDGRNWRPIHSPGPSRIQMCPVLWTHWALNADKYIEINLKWTLLQDLFYLCWWFELWKCRQRKSTKTEFMRRRGYWQSLELFWSRIQLYNVALTNQWWMAFTLEMDHCFLHEHINNKRTMANEWLIYVRRRRFFTFDAAFIPTNICNMFNNVKT